ncbi:hypothetical protein T02_218 [Trichinella nativa]|uniref:Uncharacterized protein n=1 Tax=Trichinella nativa TaxID=6335 RepID=A0A0V1KLT1_9BILA|nr:hypothetical protein T02_218 [Trichinella nativa]
MVSRLLIESGCLRLQPKAGGRETVDRQTDGADGAILTKISRRCVRWRMNLFCKLVCADYLSFRMYARCTFGRSASRATFAFFAADNLCLSQLPCQCRISRMNVVVDKMKSIVLRTIVMGLLVPLRSWVSAHDLSGTSGKKSIMNVIDLTTVRSGTIVDQSVSERAHWYPKDGELCLSRMKPEETLVEVRSGVDVQITRLT